MSVVVDNLRTGEEKLYGATATIVGTFLWLILACSFWLIYTNSTTQIRNLFTIYAIYGLLIAIFYFIGSLVYRASAFGNMLLIGANQFTKLNDMIVAASQVLGMTKIPRVFLFNSNGVVNAHARRLFGGEYVFLNSALVEVDSDEQVRFVIGHELGHHAAGHLNPWKRFVRLPAHLVPFLYPAYSRAREYTCDRLGLYVANNAEVARGSLQMLGCGCRRLGPEMNADAFVKQEELVPPVFGFLTEIFRGHPRLTRRVMAMNGRWLAAAGQDASRKSKID